MKIQNLSSSSLQVTTADGVVLVPSTFTISCTPLIIRDVTLDNMQRLSWSEVVVTDSTIIPTADYFNDFSLGFGFGLTLMAFSTIYRLVRRLTPSGGTGTDL